MPKISLFRDSLVRDLTRSIEQNLEKYRTGDFQYLLSDTTNLIETEHEYNQAEFDKVQSLTGDHQEVQCCLGIFSGLPRISAYLARDQRLWVFFTHAILLQYTRTRWPIPQDTDKAIAHIKTHFFASGGARGIERNNAVSRLWWMAKICSKVEGMSLERSLTAFLFLYDVRQNIVDRPSTSQNVLLLSAVLMKLDESFRGDKGLFNREKFRGVMKDLNLQGGTKLLDVLDDAEIKRIVTRCAR